MARDAKGLEVARGVVLGVAIPVVDALRWGDDACLEAMRAERVLAQVVGAQLAPWLSEVLRVDRLGGLGVRVPIATVTAGHEGRATRVGAGPHAKGGHVR